MLRLLFRYFFLPTALLFALGYGTIPLWAPSLVSLLSKPLNVHLLELNIGYPSHEKWHINSASWTHTTPAGTYSTTLNDISIAYTWQTLQAGEWPEISISSISGLAELNPQSLNSIPTLTLIPSQWLSSWPELTIDSFKLNVTVEQQQYGLSGNIEQRQGSLNVLSKISTPSQQHLYLDATFGLDDKVEAKLFTAQNSAPVAKITSAIKHQHNGYIWQGQGAVNLAYTHTFFFDVLPLSLAQTAIDQGKLTSHWKISLPSIDKAQHFDQWLSQAQGELQTQIQLTGNTPRIKELNLDASITQTLSPELPAIWRLNEGSVLRLTPDWNNTEVSPDLYQSLLLEQAQLTFSAGSPVVIEPVKRSNFLGSTLNLKLHGNINATLENTHSVYQIFGQLSKLQMHSLDHWQGVANLSGYYLTQEQANPWIAQLPIGLRKLQFLSEVGFDFDPKQWQLTVQPNSKISATQVVSMRHAGSVQLFASDKLNLTNGDAIQLTYLPLQDDWTWSNTSLHLKPESIPSQGIDVWVKKGSTLLAKQPIEGHFELQPTYINLPNWPLFQIQSKGQLSWLDEQLKIKFTSQLQPYINQLSGVYTWQANTADHQLSVQTQDIDLAQLLPQLNPSENSLQLPTPWLVAVTKGLVDYQADWRWYNEQVTGIQTLSYTDVNANTANYSIKGMEGVSQFEYQTKQALNTVATDKTTASLTGSHKLNATQLSWGDDMSTQLQNPTVDFTSDTGSTTQYLLRKANGLWLGGHITAAQIPILPSRSNTLPVTLQGIQLSQLINLANTPKLSASGEVSGQVNLTLDLKKKGLNGWSIDSADLASSQIGTIKLGKDETNTTSEKSAYLQDILSDFQFEHLDSKLTHNAKGNLELLTRFVGSNQYFKQGQKVDFSLTLNPQLN
ncbi:MAG: YdbH domain-containing protein [Gammaproteobacteria bacterium]|nr:YdbH domain-containing protein [Gammaproteobacteria bacterium]